MTQIALRPATVKAITTNVRKHLRFTGADEYAAVTRGVAYSSGPPTYTGGVGQLVWTTESSLHGMTLDESTGVISGTSSQGTGTIDHVLIVTVTDSRGQLATHQQLWRWSGGGSEI
jgi:hypothetical protein